MGSTMPFCLRALLRRERRAPGRCAVGCFRVQKQITSAFQGVPARPFRNPRKLQSGVCQPPQNVGKPRGGQACGQANSSCASVEPGAFDDKPTAQGARPSGRRDVPWSNAPGVFCFRALLRRERRAPVWPARCPLERGLQAAGTSAHRILPEMLLLPGVSAA